MSPSGVWRHQLQLLHINMQETTPCPKCEHQGQDFPPLMRKEGKSIAAWCVGSGRRSGFAHRLTDSLHPGSCHLQLTIGAVAPFFPTPTHTHKSLNHGSAHFDLFWVKDFILWNSETRICFLKSTYHWIPFNLTCDWNFCFNDFCFLQRLPLYLLKMTNRSHLLFHYIFCLHVLSFWDLFSFPLSVSFPQLSAASSPSSHSPHRASGKDPFAELSLEDFL